MYKITIEKKEMTTREVGGEWKVIGQTPITEKDESWDLTLAGKLRDVYGYTPRKRGPIEETTVVLVQEVGELDLDGVIRAINGMK